MEEKVKDSEMESYPPWAELTHECLINIFSRLPLEHRWRGPLFVCNSWSRAAKDSSLFSIFDIESLFDSETVTSKWGSPEFERRIDSMLRSAVVWSDGSLSQIRIRHCSDSSLLFVAQSCPNLEILSIKRCPHVTDKSMAKIALSCPKLREVDISYCYEISVESLMVIGRHCPNIKILRLKENFLNTFKPSQHTGIIPVDYFIGCPQVGDSEAAAIAKSMPNLEHLELIFSKLSAKGLRLICEGCPNLKFLDLFECVNLTSREIAYASSNLENLEIRKPNFYIPSQVFHLEWYGHRSLYAMRFEKDVLRI